jgi:hypothetical protein
MIRMIRGHWRWTREEQSSIHSLWRYCKLYSEQTLLADFWKQEKRKLLGKNCDRANGGGTHSYNTPNSLSTHCLFTVYSLSIHCLFTDYALSIHCLFTSIITINNITIYPNINRRWIDRNRGSKWVENRGWIKKRRVYRKTGWIGTRMAEGWIEDEEGWTEGCRGAWRKCIMERRVDEVTRKSKINRGWTEREREAQSRLNRGWIEDE